MVKRVLLALLALALVAPAQARGGTVSVEAGVLHFRAASGDVDWISLNDDITGALGLIGMSPVTAGPGCTNRSSNWAICAADGVERVVLELGDKDDQATTSWYAFSRPVRIDGGPGDDYLRADGGQSELYGGEGDDTFDSFGGEGAGVWSGGPGWDKALYNQRFEPLTLSLDGVANDGATGEGDNLEPDIEEVWGGYKDDLVTGSPGDDELHGGEGVDEIHGLDGNDTLDGWLGGYGDHLYGEGGDDTLMMYGATRADGGPGDDTIVPGIASCAHCVAIGGPGVDTAFAYDAGDEGSTISLDDVANDGWTGTDDYRSDIENLVAGDHGMTLIGSAGPNVLTGGDGDDVLIGAGGPDDLAGGDGFDVADYSDHLAPVTLTLDGLRNDGAAGENDRIQTDVEDLRGGAGNDLLIGDGGDNVLDGGRGADVLRGGGGLDAVDYSERERGVTARLDGTARSGEAGEGDTVGADVEGAFGGFSADLLVGNVADGFLVGFEGADRLLDNGGKDLLDAGAGEDQLDSTDASADDVVCGEGADRVWRDTRDTPDDDCEFVQAGPRPPDPEPTPTATATPTTTPTPTPTPAPRPTPRAIEDGAPRASVKVVGRLRAATLRAQGLKLTVRCDEPCRVRAELTGRRGVAARGELTRLSAQVRTLRLTSRRAWRPGRYTLTLTITDRGGNARRIVRTLRVG